MTGAPTAVVTRALPQPRDPLAPPPGTAERSRTILIAHGSPDPRHCAGVEGIARRLAELQGGEVVPSYIERNTPSASAAVTAAAGGDLTVLPLLLTAGFHWKNDIPAVVAADGRRSTLLPPPPLEAFAAATAQLIREHSGSGRDKAVVVLAGSRSPELPVRMAALLEQVEHLLTLAGSWPVEVAVARDPAAAAAGNLVDDATVVVPLVVAEGIFADRIRALASQTGALTTQVLGSTPGFAEALAAYSAAAPAR